jgi:hypothetical protein
VKIQHQGKNQNLKEFCMVLLFTNLMERRFCLILANNVLAHF